MPKGRIAAAESALFFAPGALCVPGEVSGGGPPPFCALELGDAGIFRRMQGGVYSETDARWHETIATVMR